MRARVLPLVFVWLLGCGPARSSADGFDIWLVVSAGLNDLLSGFQVSLVSQGSKLDCLTIQKSCVVSQVDASRFVTLKDGKGASHQALTVPLALVAGSPTTQDLSVSGLPVGSDYALIIEGLSKDSPPKLGATSCTYVPKLVAGSNPTVLANMSVLSPIVSCDPRIEK